MKVGTTRGFPIFEVDDSEEWVLEQNWYMQNGRVTSTKLPHIQLHRVLANAGPLDRVVFIDGNKRNLKKENLLVIRRQTNRCPTCGSDID